MGALPPLTLHTAHLINQPTLSVPSSHLTIPTKRNDFSTET